MPCQENIDRLASIIAPPPRLKLSRWADQHAWIPPEGNAEPGKYYLKRMPHQAALLDDPQEQGVRETVWMLASQAGGKTLSLIIVCLFIIHMLRRSIIVVRTTKATAKEWMTDKFIPTIDATPAMKGLLLDPRTRKSKSTQLNRKYPGGGLRAMGAKSPAEFRGTSAPMIFQDEIDSYVSIGEGDPCALADRAAITFSESWKIKCSTPTLEGFSRIHERYLAGDQQKYFVPCKCCGGFQPLEFDDLKFSFLPEEYARFEQPKFHPNNFTWLIGDAPTIDTKRAIMVCRHCHRGWSDADRIAAYMSGHPENAPVVVDGKELRAEWRATAPFNGVRSRHLEGMCLTIGLKPGMDNYLQQFAEQYLEAKKGGRDSLMVWTNTFRSLPFSDATDKLEWEPLKKRAEDYGPELPVEVMFLIGGMDVHPDRVEIHIMGWGSQQEVWSIEYVVIYGDFDMPEMQQRVEEYLLNRRFTHPVLGELDIRACGIDSGHQTKVKAVYHFSRKHFTRNIWAVKGFADPLGSIYTASVEKRLRLTRFNLNTDVLKATIYDRLRNTEPGANYIHFPKEEITFTDAEGKTQKLKTKYDNKFYMQLCSERRIPERQKNGGIIFHWRKPTSSTRNEALDTTVYAFGVYEIVKRVGYIERKWKDVQKILAEREKGNPAPNLVGTADQKAYQIKPESEAKLPELKQVPTAPVRSTSAPPPRRRTSGFGGFSKGFSKGKWGI